MVRGTFIYVWFCEHQNGQTRAKFCVKMLSGLFGTYGKAKRCGISFSIVADTEWWGCGVEMLGAVAALSVPPPRACLSSTMHHSSVERSNCTDHLMDRLSVSDVLCSSYFLPSSILISEPLLIRTTFVCRCCCSQWSNAASVDSVTVNYCCVGPSVGICMWMLVYVIEFDNTVTQLQHFVDIGKQHGRDHCRSVRPSVCPSVRHTLLPYQNDASYDHELFTGSSVNDSAAGLCKCFLQIPKRSFRSRALNERVVGKISDFQPCNKSPYLRNGAR